MAQPRNGRRWKAARTLPLTRPAATKLDALHGPARRESSSQPHAHAGSTGKSGMTSNENGPFSSVATHQYVAPLEQHAERNRQMPCRARAPAGEAQLAPGEPLRSAASVASVASAPLPGFHRWRHCHHLHPSSSPAAGARPPTESMPRRQPTKQRKVGRVAQGRVCGSCSCAGASRHAQGVRSRCAESPRHAPATALSIDCKSAIAAAMPFP